MKQKPDNKRPGGNGAAPAPTSVVQAKSLASIDEIEPQVDSAAMPAWLFVLMIALVYWGMLHLDRYGGGFNNRVYGPYRSFKELSDLQPKSGSEMLVAKGESVYALICAACHQQSGLGAPGQFPPLVGSEWVLGSPNRLIRIPLHGLTGNIQVKGQVWTGVQMPAFGGGPPLSDDENLAAVLSYVRQAWGNKAPAITPEQVKAVRAETASRSSQWTSDELLKVPE